MISVVVVCCLVNELTSEEMPPSFLVSHMLYESQNTNEMDLDILSHC